MQFTIDAFFLTGLISTVMFIRELYINPFSSFELVIQIISGILALLASYLDNTAIKYGKAGPVVAIIQIKSIF